MSSAPFKSSERRLIVTHATETIPQSSVSITVFRCPLALAVLRFALVTLPRAGVSELDVQQVVRLLLNIPQRNGFTG